ncbi:MAG: helix-hairpin-helix domain-containing protein [Candidatus Omnitrophota bacterium]
MAFLTKTEKYVIFFLVAGALFGIGYSYYKQFFGPLWIDAKKDTFRRRPAVRKDLDRILEKAKSVNINTASYEELMRLDGIGPVLGNRIIEYRNEHGDFSYKEEIKDVSGMGDKKFEAIKDYLEVE